MTTRSPKQRRIPRAVLPFGAGGAAFASALYVGTPVWVAGISALASALIGVVPHLLPQESEHRLALWRALFRHLETMKGLRLDAARAEDLHDRSPG
ncbi:hypothetical protein ACWC24_36225 [Streptomyces sp. NPDC001443]